jgi:hypothetical protein
MTLQQSNPMDKLFRGVTRVLAEQVRLQEQVLPKFILPQARLLP